MMGANLRADRSSTPARVLLLLLSTAFLLAGFVVIIGVGLVAFLGQRGDDGTWARWSSVGQAFGVVNSVVSALAVAALVITFMLQSRDRHAQQAELVVQRRILEGTECALRRSADVDVRKLHVTLIRLALDNPHLAEVWPSDTETSSVAHAQHMYANLMLQHVWLQYTTGITTREEMISNVRNLFASPKVRAFWRDTANARRSIYVDGTTEFSLAMVADQIWREYESVLACSGEGDSERSGYVRTSEDPLDGGAGDIGAAQLG